MLLAIPAAASPKIGATRSRLAKRALLAEVIAQADPAELGLLVTYLAGSLRQRRTGVGWSALSELPEPAEEPELTLAEVDAAFESMSHLTGPGSVGRRAEELNALLRRATVAEQHYLTGLVFADLRQGALDALVVDALAAAHGIPIKVLQRAAMLLGSSAAAADRFAAGGIDALEAVGLQVGTAVQPMLAAPAADVVGALEKSPLPVIVDAKLDGIRVQVHRNGDIISVYTRSLDEITDRLPEIVESVAALPVTSIVLDGEAVALGPDGRPQSFQIIASRTASRLDVDAGRARTPLQMFAFDLLHVDGEDLLDLPLSERVKRMEAILPADLVVPRRHASTQEEVTQIFADAIGRGFEGVVVKNLQSPYAAGRRDSGWIKLKPRHTFDLAVIAAEWGYGRRQGWLSNLHLAARHPVTGDLVMLGKTFKGLTDKILTWQTEQIQAREVRRTKTTVYIEPPLVVEIAVDGIQQSTRYPGGIALRFARVLRYREDKTPDDIDSLDTVLLLGQGPRDAGGDENESATVPAADGSI